MRVLVGHGSGDECLPMCAGLSSSSALVVAAALATARCTQLQIDPQNLLHKILQLLCVFFLSKFTLAELCARCERLIGTQGGGMDQAACLLANESPIFIEFTKPKSTVVPVAIPPSGCFVIVDSGVRLHKAASPLFNQRVSECRIAVQVSFPILCISTFLQILSELCKVEGGKAAQTLSDIQRLWGKAEPGQMLGEESPLQRKFKRPTVGASEWDDKVVIRPTIGIADRLGHQRVLSISPLDEDIVQKLPVPRPREHPRKLLSRREAEGVGQQPTVFHAGSQKKKAVFVAATKTVGPSIPYQAAWRQAALSLNRAARHPRRLPISTMGHGFVLVRERPELAWAAYWVAVASTVGLSERGRWEVRESDLPGLEAHTAPETLTWFSPPVVTVARGIAAGQNPAPRNRRSAGAYGSRLTGAGWGGCVVSLVSEATVKDFMKQVASEYFRQSVEALSSQIFYSVPGRAAGFVRVD
ncbi:unnamed protein product [Schistocephalus solidus]|uniref:GHMP_kinases_N domain-containing protein n=1 Tax=Schistocephalus solidus TaxID=70667 RepID=A0A183SID6_SCHSO|nr:unnamed protein product [Schistocephalus solidus]